MNFYEKNSVYENISFTGKSENGYSNLTFLNGVFTKVNYLKGGDFTDLIYGEYERENDSVFVFELLSDHSKANILFKFKEFQKENSSVGLIDLENNTKFY